MRRAVTLPARRALGVLLALLVATAVLVHHDPPPMHAGMGEMSMSAMTHAAADQPASAVHLMAPDAGCPGGGMQTCAAAGIAVQHLVPPAAALTDGAPRFSADAGSGPFQSWRDAPRPPPTAISSVLRI